MKHYLLYILFFVSCCDLNGMDQDHEENRFSVCNQIKQIAPNASRAEYLELAKNLSENNLSTCACMKYLMQEREKKAIELIKKENSIADEYQEAMMVVFRKELDANAKNGNPLTIHCSLSLLDSATIASIKEKFSRKYRPTIELTTKEPCYPSSMIACGDHCTVSSTENREIGINSTFKKLSSNARNAVLEREKYDLETNNGVLRRFWTSSLINSGHTNKRSTIDEQLKVCSKLKRAHEAAADRVPAACNDCKLAFDFVEYFEWCSGYNCGLISGLIAKMSNYFRKDDTSEKRLQWAKRIYNLKLAEQELKQNFAISKDVGHQE